ncbi:CPBP family intramembrane glutamic endopeptidase [Lacrimispora sp. AGF001]|uniref:CPBP family intramembrane glutamic endopeptidase n=1 Tax=Lacrimispora sp. AGF001 TaxID=3401631 RepID=UPI003B42E19E
MPKPCSNHMNGYMKHLLCFVISTYLVTWVLWLASFQISGFFRIIGSFVPSAMGIVFIYGKSRKEGLKTLFNSLKRYRVKWYVYFFVMLYTIFSLLVPHLLAGVFKYSVPFQVKRSIGIFNISDPISASVCFLAILTAGGPLGEEFGWRGFLLPELEKKLSPCNSGIVVGIVWACWHLPMFLFHVDGYQISFLLYLIQTISLSIICTWIYHASGKSMLMILLFHTVDNFVCSIAYQALLNGKNIYTAFYWIIQIILLIYIVMDLRRYNKSDHVY